MKIKFFCLYLLAIFLLCAPFSVLAQSHDTTEVIALNKKALGSRLSSLTDLIALANKALTLADKITDKDGTLGYKNGQAEANRVLGIGYYYQNEPVKALQSYLLASKYYQAAKNQDGEAKVINNIGTLYRESDHDEAIRNYDQALAIAQKVGDQNLIATIYLNYGVIYYKEKKLQQALDYYNKCDVLFQKLHDEVNSLICLQNKGVIWYNLNRLDTAQVLLLKANEEAKAKDLNTTVASINLTLTSIFIAKSQFDKASYYLNEGLSYAKIIGSTKLQNDYEFTRYQLENKRKNYQEALKILYKIYVNDSLAYKNSVPNMLQLEREKAKQEENKHNNEMMLAQQSRDRILFWSTVLVAGLLVGLVVVLVSNVNRKAKTNKDLTRLNEKITEQKENLNQINHHLEEIIDDRTKDLQIKNKKLADYSLHLSHQIRGPIATLKGLLNLEKDNLIEKDECIKLMNKCVSEIDDNIIDMSGMLHETSKKP